MASLYIIWIILTRSSRWQLYRYIMFMFTNTSCLCYRYSMFMFRDEHWTNISSKTYTWKVQTPFFLFPVFVKLSISEIHSRLQIHRARWTESSRHQCRGGSDLRDLRHCDLCAGQCLELGGDDGCSSLFSSLVVSALLVFTSSCFRSLAFRALPVWTVH